MSGSLPLRPSGLGLAAVYAGEEEHDCIDCRRSSRTIPNNVVSKYTFRGLVNIKEYIKIQKTLDTIHPTHPPLYPKKIHENLKSN